MARNSTVRVDVASENGTHGGEFHGLEVRREKGLIPKYGVGSFHEVLNGFSFRHISSHTDSLSFLKKLFIPVHGENENRHFRVESQNRTSCVETVHHGHRNVKNDQIRLQRLCFVDCFLPINGLCAHLEIRAGCESRAYSLSDSFLIVCN